MTDEIRIRPETPEDAPAIEEVTVAAFRDLEVSNQTEHLIVAALRSAGALSVSLVAQLDGRIVGHIAFSPVEISDGSQGWYGLGPVSVLPEYQRRGIGSALIEAGLDRLRASGARGCCLVGHPGYYTRFGFANTTDLAVEGVPGEVFFALPLCDEKPRGTVAFHDAFGAGT